VQHHDRLLHYLKQPPAFVTHPFSYVQFTAEATLHTYDEGDLDELRVGATRIAGRYMGADRAEAYGKRNAVPEEYIVRAKITKTIAQADIAD
jgi:hypothetical protein